ncbi:hypothetical protein EJB05_16023, partial [Eragrostis curvula]
MTPASPPATGRAPASWSSPWSSPRRRFGLPHRQQQRGRRRAHDHAGADLAFLPGLSAAEKESMLRADDDPDGVVVLHSAAGLVLCCRARVRTARYYVCNPVTRQHVALPKLEEEAPARKHECRCGLLTLTADTKSSFRVVIVHWPEDLDQTMCLDLSVFSSDTGQWEVRKLALPPDLCYEDIFGSPPILGQSGTSYWIWHTWADYAIAYNSSSANNPILEIALPPRLPGWEDNRCIGERRHGWGLQFAQSNSSSVLEVWKSDLIGGRWSLSLRVTIADLVALNPEVAGSFMCDRYGNTRINPVGFHPTDEDVVFIAMPGAVFAYSMERGTLTLLRRTKDCLIPADVYPYTHPDYPVQVPAIKDDAAVMIMELPRQQCGCSTETPCVTGILSVW